MDERYPAFENAALQFQEFLTTQGWPPQLLWIRPSDARFLSGRIRIRSRSEALGEAHARSIYSKAVTARLGVMLEALCRADGHTFARVVRPIDDDASLRGLFPSGLKLTVPVNPLDAALASRLTWLLFTTAPRWPPRDADIEA
jgi:hypothetical protein